MRLFIHIKMQIFLLMVKCRIYLKLHPAVSADYDLNDTFIAEIDF